MVLLPSWHVYLHPILVTVALIRRCPLCIRLSVSCLYGVGMCICGDSLISKLSSCRAVAVGFYNKRSAILDSFFFFLFSWACGLCGVLVIVLGVLFYHSFIIGATCLNSILFLFAHSSILFSCRYLSPSSHAIFIMSVFWVSLCIAASFFTNILSARLSCLLESSFLIRCVAGSSSAHNGIFSSRSFLICVCSRLS